MGPFSSAINKRFSSAFNKIAGSAKSKSAQVAGSARTGMSSGAMQKAKNSKVAKAVASHPYRSGAAGVAGLGAASYVTGSSRRGRGVDKMRGGRPTGMYKY